jgi:hypothetical protein
MAIRYEITWRDHITSEQSRDHRVFARSDAAKRALYDVAREMVASWAGLDTKWGWAFMREVMDCDCSAPPMGYFRSQQFTMPQGDVLTFWAQRI